VIYARLAGTGSYLPQKVLTNADMEKIVDTSDEWIFSRTGIRERRIADETETTSAMGLAASQRAIEAAGVEARDIDLIVFATTTPDMVFPSTACILQAKLGIKGCAAFDVQAVCSGFVYAMATADNFIRAGQSKCALVVGAETYSRILDWKDRGTCVLFGDGAGAVVLKASDKPGILSTHLHADGSHAAALAVPGWVKDGKAEGLPLLKMEGGTVFKFAVRVLEEVGREAAGANRMSPSDIDWFIPHQANIRIIEASAKKLGLAMEKVILTVHKHGNTSAASIPLALDEAIRDGRVKTGQTVLLEGVGGGFTWGAVLLRY
jgi:3-oxoacyl-[acyl-carrier-protein] synthase III